MIRLLAGIAALATLAAASDCVAAGEWTCVARFENGLPPGTPAGVPATVQVHLRLVGDKLIEEDGFTKAFPTLAEPWRVILDDGRGLVAVHAGTYGETIGADLVMIDKRSGGYRRIVGTSGASRMSVITLGLCSPS